MTLETVLLGVAFAVCVQACALVVLVALHRANKRAAATVLTMRTEIEALPSRILNALHELRTEPAPQALHELHASIVAGLAKHAASPASSRPGHHTASVRRAFVERELAAHGHVSAPLDLDARIRKLHP